jgi:hypothetical protein
VEKEPNGDMKHPIEGFIPIVEDLYKTSTTLKVHLNMLGLFKCFFFLKSLLIIPTKYCKKAI